MKPVKKLTLNKETLKALGAEQVQDVAGGATLWMCTTWCTLVGRCKTEYCGGTTTR